LKRRCPKICSACSNNCGRKPDVFVVVGSDATHHDTFSRLYHQGGWLAHLKKIGE
jgi:hypothetical protein